jgi:hypothetical protein
MSIEPALDRVAVQAAQARKDFRNHQIVKESLGRWLVQQPDNCAFWFECVVLEGGYLLVHGDIQAVLFGIYSAHRDTPKDIAALQTLYWMAQRTRPDDHYFVEKAQRGTSRDTIWTYDEAVLRDEIRDLIREAHETEAETENKSIGRKFETRDGFPSNKPAVRSEELEYILENVGSDTTLEETQRAIYELFDGDCESVPQGKIVSAAMIHAHAALQRLAELLDARPCPLHEDSSPIV